MMALRAYLAFHFNEACTEEVTSDIDGRKCLPSLLIVIWTRYVGHSLFIGGGPE